MDRAGSRRGRPVPASRSDTPTSGCPFVQLDHHISDAIIRGRTGGPLQRRSSVEFRTRLLLEASVPTFGQQRRSICLHRPHRRPTLRTSVGRYRSTIPLEPGPSQDTLLQPPAPCGRCAALASSDPRPCGHRAAVTRPDLARAVLRPSARTPDFVGAALQPPARTPDLAGAALKSPARIPGRSPRSSRAHRPLRTDAVHALRSSARTSSGPHRVPSTRSRSLAGRDRTPPAGVDQRVAVSNRRRRRNSRRPQAPQDEKPCCPRR